ncbi:outer membrane protein assembly factor BamA [Chryseobacterium sp. MDT2-18]|nr:outer membrane protein assembly factor BamA [Chryseobacterium sp. MDT2-18]
MSSNKETILLKTLFHFFFLFSCVFLKAQTKEYWLIDVQTKKKTMAKDSASAVKFLDSLTQNHYYFTEIKKVKREGNSTQIYFNKGKNYNETQVKLSGEIVKSFKYKPEFFTKNLDSLKKEISEKYRNQGFVFNRVKSEFKGLKEEIAQIEISVAKGEQRKIDGIVLKGYEKVPHRFVKNLEKEYQGKSYQEQTLANLAQSLQNHPFLLLEKPPQTLFTKDSTQVFLFLQKKKSNSFDGVIGFGNDKTEKFTFNGSLNLNFRNMFNGFETVNIFWQRNPDKGQTFDLQSDSPYLFKSNIGGNFKVNIFRQDSTYANVKLTPAFYLHLRNNQKIGLRGTFETSTVLDSLYVQGRDYDKKGIGMWYDYSQPSDVELFLFKTRLRAEADYIATSYTAENINASQTNYFFSGERNFHISGNNYLNLRGETALLNSKNDFAVNELLRFGGWNSFRGFNENSLYADFYYFGTAEYRYLVGNQAFFDVFGQYGELHNKNLGLKPKLYSLGLGFNFILPIGLMSFQISNGSEFGNPIKFGDTKIHWGILSRF